MNFPAPMRWGAALAVYRDVRMARILLIGTLSGLPQVALLSMMILWLQESGFSRTDIGLFGTVAMVYALNVAWAPLVDGVRIPYLAARFGRRRAWVVLMQILVVAGLAWLSALDPAWQITQVVAAALLLAVGGATQDVVLDALRIEQFAPQESRKVGAGSAMATSGWWIGYGAGGGLALAAVHGMQEAGFGAAWQGGFLLLAAATVLLVVLFLWLVPEPAREVPAQVQDRPGLAVVWEWYARAVRDFLSRYGVRLALWLLLAIFLFKIGEAFLGRMSLLFYTEVGFDKSEIALYSKGYATVTMICFAILGSIVNARYGIWRGLLLGGVAMALTNLLFALLAYYPEAWLFATAVIADQFTTAVSTVAFVAFLSQLCDRTSTATQYAALASLGTLSRTTLAAGSGFLVDGLGGNWPLFFVLTSLMVLPSLALLIWKRKRLVPHLEGARPA